MIMEINEKNFENEVLKSNLPILVDFWAPWCAPCQMIAPVLEDIAKEYEGKIKLAKVNIQENENLANQYGIMAIPYLKIFKDGRAVDEIIGFQSKEAIVERIKSVLS
jgi:thioredoxin 1